MRVREPKHFYKFSTKLIFHQGVLTSRLMSGWTCGLVAMLTMGSGVTGSNPTGLTDTVLTTASPLTRVGSLNQLFQCLSTNEHSENYYCL